MQIIAVGLNHKTAPVGIRETISFPESVIRDAVKTLGQYKHIKESVILSTCNRVEVYSVVDDEDKGIAAVKGFMAHYNNKKVKDIEEHLYTYSGEAMVNHVFRVVASLDSMIVGEPQIFGQMKNAYNYAFEIKNTKNIFNTLFKFTSQVGKEVRSDTDIGKNAVSISFAAVELAKKIFGDVEGKTVMIVGAGEGAIQRGPVGVVDRTQLPDDRLHRHGDVDAFLRSADPPGRGGHDWQHLHGLPGLGGRGLRHDRREPDPLSPRRLRQIGRAHV